MFGESLISAFWVAIGRIDLNDFHVSDFHVFSCGFCTILMFSDAPKGCFFDSGEGFKAKVGSHTSTSWRHDFGGSSRPKIMKFHDFDFPLFSLLISIFS